MLYLFSLATLLCSSLLLSAIANTLLALNYLLPTLIAMSLH